MKPDDTMTMLVAMIRERHRLRDDLLRADGNLTRQAKAICRRAVGFHTLLPAAERRVKLAEATALYDAVESGGEHPKIMLVAGSAIPLLEARVGIRANKRAMERELSALAQELPVYATFVEPIRGFGAIGLGQIIGEAGNLADYANPAKLWKRMGLGLVDGGRQRMVKDKDAAERHGYSPRRRSVMFVIGDSLLKSQSAYKVLYDERKAYEIARAEAAGLIVVPAAKIKEGTEAAHFSHGHAHNRAKRYVEKRLLRDLWRAWRGEGAVA